MLFGWTPDIFWSATPAELAALMRAVGGGSGAGIDRAAVAKLQEIFPDG